jgi:hypothetical protein
VRTTGNFAGFPAYLKTGLSGNAAASYNCINTRPTARAHGQATREVARRQSVGGVQPGGACDISQVDTRTCAHHACRKAIGKSPVSAAGQALGKGFACAQTHPMIWTTCSRHAKPLYCLIKCRQLRWQPPHIPIHCLRAPYAGTTDSEPRRHNVPTMP